MLLKFLREEGARRGLRPLAVTFDPHPLALVAPERQPLSLTSCAERRRLLEREGVEVAEIPFDERLRHLTAREWIAEMRRRFGAKVLVMGYDHRFGSDGRTLQEGDYERIGREEGVEILRAPELPGVSSSAIRRALGEGDVERAAELLGRPFMVEGRVVHGAGKGHELGFPTANIDVAAGMALPSGGVYHALADAGDGVDRPAVVNIGMRPTLADGRGVTVEAHIPGFEGDLYGKPMRLSFLRRLRPERRFASLDELREAIAEDCKSLSNSE